MAAHSELEDREKDILRVSSLYKYFGKKQAVRGVDFSMHTGEILGDTVETGHRLSIYLALVTTAK